MFKSGDILVHSTANWNDFFSIHTIGLDPGHATVVLQGRSLDIFSSKGVSPSQTYVVAYPSHLWPIEYFLNKYWSQANSTSLSVIQRVSGPELSDKQICEAWSRSLSQSRNTYLGYQRKIMAYFKLNGLSTSSGINSCAELATYLLFELGLVQKDAILSNILPNDLLSLRFYQTVDYRRIDLFDKQLNSWDWFRAIPFIQLGWVTPEPISLSFEPLLPR